MPPSPPSIAPPLSAERTVARSRSRYKGPRLHKTPTDLSDLPSFGREQAQRLHAFSASPREPRPQNNKEDRRGFQIEPPCHEVMQRHRSSLDDAQGSDAFTGQNRGNTTEVENRIELQNENVSPSHALQGCQQEYQLRRHNEQAERHKEAGQGSLPRRKAAASSEQYSHYPGLELHFPKYERAAGTIDTPALPRNGLTQRVPRRSTGERLHKAREELKKTISAPIPIEPAQDVVKPAFDAPVSAVNAGERRVRVKIDQNLVSLPVTPSTTSLEIIRSAADQLAEPLDPDGTVLFESFKLLGLERPLRRYEHVRDVLNSWNDDTQNTLLIKPSSTGGGDDWLDLKSVSTSQPVDTSVYIHYSQRPGRWDKRWVTLRSDGQMLVAKSEGGETANICHMSDFDIYFPMIRQSAKRIRPPRKICFAVKSQQKSSMFLSTANFVHFFSTSDKILAATWYKAVREWRSRYLMNVMGEGEGSPQNFKSVPTKVGSQDIPNTRLENQRKPSQGKNPPTVSTLASRHAEHLVSITNSNFGHSVVGTPVDDIRFRSRSKIKSSQFKKLSKDTDLGAPREYSPPIGQIIRPKEPEPFAATGLLGRTYTHRQKAQREHEKAQTARADQLAATHNDVGLANQLNQAPSQRPKPKPLIDLTPQYQEPPQHAKKGRGIILEQIPAGGLVEVANTPEAAIPIPPSTTWRRPTSRGGDEPSVDRSKTVRRDHSNGTPSEPKQTLASPNKRDVFFTGGLLARDSRGRGVARMSRRVTTRDGQADESILGIGEE